MSGPWPFRPLKGPMTTQSLRGLPDQGPLHWRGDKTNSTNEYDDVSNFIGFSGAFVGQQVSADASNWDTTEIKNRINLMVDQANDGNAELIVNGINGGVQRGAVYIGSGQFSTDIAGEPNLTTTQVRTQASVAGQEIVFTPVPEPGVVVSLLAALPLLRWLAARRCPSSTATCSVEGPRQPRWRRTSPCVPGTTWPSR